VFGAHHLEFDEETGYPLEIRDAVANHEDHDGTTLTYQTGMGGHIADLIAKPSPEGRTWSFEYTSEGDLASVTDPMGNTEGDFTTTYTYDEWGQLLTATDANGHTTTNSDFDANGYPETITDALGESTTFSYDERGQVTEVTDPLGAGATQAYDVFGGRWRARCPRIRTRPSSSSPPRPRMTPMTRSWSDRTEWSCHRGCVRCR
jgi:YD repeat-containing protein